MLVEQSAEQLLRLSMELGGNAPFLVFEDADVDAAVDGAMLAKMRNIGEACTAANRFFVHESVAVRVRDQVRGPMGALVVGKGTKKGVEVGPLITGKARDGRRTRPGRRRQGAPACSPVARPCRGKGFFYAPTVLADVPADSRSSGGDLRSGRADVHVHRRGGCRGRANGTEYGLVAYVFTRDMTRMIRVSEELEFGMVGINTGIVSNPAAPFGGVKQSAASAARAASRGSTSTSRRSTSRCRCSSLPV
jgi:succinate-semialdehyde dehydrogenase/glutarate-semialdehyde dehydrogenase